MSCPTTFLRACAAGLAFGLAAQAACAAGPDLAGYRFTAPITVPANGGLLVRVAIPAEVSAGADPSLADLRVFGSDGGSVPFVILRSEGGGAPEEAIRVQPSAAQRTESGGWILDIAVPDGVPGILGFCLESASTGFFYSAELAAGELGSGAPRLSGAIYNFNPSVRAQQLCLDVPGWSARSLRLQLSPGNELAVRRLNIDLSDSRGSVTELIRRQDIRIGAIRLVTRRAEHWSPVIDSIELGAPEVLSAQRATRYRWEAKHLPVDAVLVEVDERLFSRPITLRGWSADERLLWEQPARLERRLDDPREAIRIGLGRRQSSVLEIEIEDGDSPRLRIPRAEARVIRRELIFQAEPGAGYTLAWGADGAAAPSFDLGRALPQRQDELAAIPQGTLGAPALNPHYAPGISGRWAAFWSRFGLITFTLLIALGLAFWLWRLMAAQNRA